MPSESPHLPKDGYQRLLAGRNANAHLGLLAGEVATFDKPPVLAKRLIKAAITAAILCGTMAIGTKI